MSEFLSTRNPGARMSCTKAIAAGLRDGGIEFITNFPGFHSHDIFSLAGGTTTSVNEKAAYAMAWGASLAGRRSAVTFKNVGLNDAADAFLNSMLLGINSGFVVVVVDDIDMEGSQIRLDSRHYFDFYRGLWFDPVSIQQAYDGAFDSFDLSERFQVPVVIRLTNRLLSRTGVVERRPRQVVRRRFVRDGRRFVAHPLNAQFQQLELAGRQKAVADFVEGLYEGFEGQGGSELKIVVGPPLEEAEADTPLLSVFTYPPPERLLKQLVSRFENIVVCEHGDSFVAKVVTGLCSIDKVKSEPIQPPELQNTYHNHERYEKLFAAVRGFEDRIVCGDLGEYTMDPHRTIDACLCFGSSGAVAVGAAMANQENTVFCVTGDGAFLHSGKNVIAEALARKVDMTILLLDNGGSRTTGGQIIPGDIEGLAGLSVVKSVEYESTSFEVFGRLLREMNLSSGVRLLTVKKNNGSD